MAVTKTLGQLFRPLTSVLDPSELDGPVTVSTDAPTGYTSAFGTRWDSAKLNKQTSNFVAADPSRPEVGGINRVSGSTSAEVGDIEFLLEGDRFTLMVQAFGYADFQIYVDDQKVGHDVITVDHEGYVFVDVKFARPGETRKIRITLPLCFFVQIIHELDASVSKSADRFHLAIIGDSYGSQGYAGPGTSMIGSTPLHIAESTGFAVTRLSQGSTGYIANANGAGGNSAYGSTSRHAALVRANPDAVLVWGTINDGANSETAIANAAKAHWTAVRNALPNAPIIVAGMEPWNRDGNAQGSRNTALKNAANSHAAVSKFVDWYGATMADAWWTGTGSMGAPTGDGRQDKVCGPDGIHPGILGAKYLGRRFAEEIASTKVS